MGRNTPQKIALEFIKYINNRDIDGLSNLMSDDHVFIDSENSRQAGKEKMIEACRRFFTQFPDYKNHFSSVEDRNNQVVIRGRSTCSFEALDGHAIWTAAIKDGLIAEWRVYKDTPGNRSKLDLSK